MCKRNVTTLSTKVAIFIKHKLQALIINDVINQQIEFILLDR